MERGKGKGNVMYIHYGSCSSIGRISRICRMVTVPRMSPDQRVSPSGQKASLNPSELRCSGYVATHDPSLVLHNPNVPSSSADAMYFPQGEKQASLVVLCPSSENSSTAVCAFQRFTMP
ncbi:hypothetical protein GSI_01516 [Ganoderma sinense ZZ0214-1]|uniref:Uncharacterized protein n=1 Tax=Ganoderma sinense ZZ0214-1 TaxID=1077348 RepID=A0A2G8SQ12_9APHY|nr:hypothetical protein GSI_01516 [Ganoderma sinense ZZ0214-1]